MRTTPLLFVPLLLSTVTVSSCSCKPDLTQNQEQLNPLWREGYNYPNSERIKQGLLPAKPELTESQKHLNRLWREGYGYNNPNSERIKQGLPPEDFFKHPDD